MNARGLRFLLLGLLSIVLGACDQTTAPERGGEQTTSTGGSAVMVSSLATANANADAGADEDNESASLVGPPFEVFLVKYDVFASDVGVSATGHATLDVRLEIDSNTNVLSEYFFSASASATANSSDSRSACAGGNLGSNIVIEVVDDAVSYEFTGTIEPGREDQDVRVRIRRALDGGGWDYPHVFDSVSDFSTTGVLEVGTYMVQVWCQTRTCSSDAEPDTATLDGSFRIVSGDG